jgi:hypothetical protein
MDMSIHFGKRTGNPFSAIFLKTMDLTAKKQGLGGLTGGGLAIACPTNCLTWRIFGDSLYGVVGM